jgi:putative tryptophan/tyrosine transport system substrate-binding protein
MKRNLVILSTLLFLLTFSQGPAQAGQEILAVQSVRIQPYEEALNGFESVGNTNIRRLIISEMNGASVLDKIKKIKPAVVLAIGMDALTQLRTITDVPVIYLMVLSPPSAISGKKNIYGVRMNISQEQQLRSLFDVLPETKAIGLLYDPDRTGDLAEQAKEAAGKHGAKVVAKAVRHSKDVPGLIQEMKGRIDVFLMLPDLTVVTPETFEALVLFSLANKIPLVTFSEKYVEMGALMSTGIDAFDMGVQAGEMAEQILSEGDTVNGRQVDARKTIISINRKVAKTLGIAINERIIRKAKTID